MAEGTIQLAGRKFRTIGNSTLEHDVWVMGRLRQAGLDSLTLDAGEKPEDYAHRLLSQLLTSERALEIVGALIVPAELPSLKWTPRVARDTAVFLGRLADPRDKLEVQRLLLAVLVPFLESGLACLRRSPAASGPSRPDAAGSAGGTATETGEG